jgi:hypothetical protein
VGKGKFGAAKERLLDDAPAEVRQGVTNCWLHDLRCRESAPQQSCLSAVLSFERLIQCNARTAAKIQGEEEKN